MFFSNMARQLHSQETYYIAASSLTTTRQELWKYFYAMHIFVLLLCFATLHATPSFDTRIFEGSQTQDPLDTASKHFVIVITSYNNQQWYLKNITSACNQAYTNFEIIFTDDCSPDKTGDLVETFLENNPPRCKVTLIKNHTRCGALQNIYRSISRCNPEDIIVSLDGDDWLANPDVLSTLNNVYANKKVWMTHGQLQMYPGGNVCDWSKKMPADVVQNNSYRSHPNIPTHLRTFYVWLFHKIKLEDLLHNGSFYPVTWDMAFMIPMMEISGGKHAFINQVLYIYNETNPINDFKVNKPLQRALDLKIRAKKPYKPIKTAPLNTTITRNRRQNAPVDLFIVSQDKPFELEDFLTSIQELVHGHRHVYVAWTARSEKIAALYKSLIPEFPGITFMQYSSAQNVHVIYVLFLRYLKKSNGYVLTCRDTVPFKHSIDLTACVKALENTQAHGVYWIDELNTYDFKHVDINGQIKAWQFSYTPESWKNGNCIAALYKSSSAIDSLLSDHITPTRLLSHTMPNQVGLFLEA